MEVHFDWIKTKYPHLIEFVDIIRRSLYVDDLIAGGFNVKFLEELKDKAQFIFKEASFELHKWHSNIRALEDATSSDGSDEAATVHHREVVDEPRAKTKLLGLPWDKDKDS